MKANDLLKMMLEDDARPQGLCVRGQWKWTVGRDNEPCGRAVNNLRASQLVDCIYFSGGKAACNLTENGRAMRRVEDPAAKRAAAIPAKLFELLEAKITSSSVHVVIDAMANVPSKADLVELWNAIVAADKSL